MRARHITAIALAVLALPVLVLGLIDPLEGGIALLAAVVLIVAIRLLSRLPIPKLTWISMTAAVAIGVLVLALAAFANSTSAGGGSAPNPVDATVVGLLWAYRIAVLVAIAGDVVYLVRLTRAVRGSSEGTAAARGAKRAGSS